jgi:hypothetical protein
MLVCRFITTGARAGACGKHIFRLHCTRRDDGSMQNRRRSRIKANVISGGMGNRLRTLQLLRSQRLDQAKAARP